MRSRTPLVLMEQLIMVLVFALAAALCVQAFVLADRSSRVAEARDRAVLEAQNAAELLKSVHGDLPEAARLYGGAAEDGRWTVLYDENWDQTGDGGAYALRVIPAESGQPLLGMADITVLTAEGNTLFALTAAWQEVDGNG